MKKRLLFVLLTLFLLTNIGCAYISLPIFSPRKDEKKIVVNLTPEIGIFNFSKTTNHYHAPKKTQPHEEEKVKVKPKKKCQCKKCKRKRRQK